MVMKENINLKGTLCLYRNIPVLVLQRALKQFNFTNDQSYLVLFPHGGIDTVNVNTLKLISWYANQLIAGFFVFVKRLAHLTKPAVYTARHNRFIKNRI